MGVEMDRVIATYRVGIHEVDVVETVDDEAAWYRVVVDGVPRDDVFSIPPTSVDAAGLVTAGRGGPPRPAAGTTRAAGIAP